MNIFLIEDFKEIQKISHFIVCHNIPLEYAFHYDSLLLSKLIFYPEQNLKTFLKQNTCFLNIFKKELINFFCLFMDSSKFRDSEFSGLTLTTYYSITLVIFRAMKFSSIFTLKVQVYLRFYYSFLRRRNKPLFLNSKSVLSSIIGVIIHFCNFGKNSFLIATIKNKLRLMNMI